MATGFLSPNQVLASSKQPVANGREIEQETKYILYFSILELL
jgi:hypothetical protein